MWALLAPILNSIFGQAFTAFVSAYTAKLTAENSSEQIAATLAARELAVQQTEIQAQNQLRIAEIGRWYEPDKLCEYVVVIYFFVGVVFNKVLGVGSIPTLGPEFDPWAQLIIAFMFGKRGIENVARIIKR